MTEIVTERLVLRRLGGTDFAAFLRYQAHPSVREFMPGKAMDEDEVRAFLKRQEFLADLDRDVYHAWGVVLATGGEIIGDVGFYLPKGEDRVGDLGFQFHPGRQGKGYATEAARELVRYGFNALNLDRITSSCDARNERSWRLMERLGMSPIKSKEGSSEKSYELTRQAWLAGS